MKDVPVRHGYGDKMARHAWPDLSKGRLMPARKDRKQSNKEQSERFKETARHIGVDESGKTFERAFKKLVPPKRPRTPNK
jgi:hypothetical protein